jgi:hypothetical protein
MPVRSLFAMKSGKSGIVCIYSFWVDNRIQDRSNNPPLPPHVSSLSFLNCYDWLDKTFLSQTHQRPRQVRQPKVLRPRPRLMRQRLVPRKLRLERRRKRLRYVVVVAEVVGSSDSLLLLFSMVKIPHAHT